MEVDLDRFRNPEMKWAAYLIKEGKSHLTRTASPLEAKPPFLVVKANGRFPVANVVPVEIGIFDEWSRLEFEDLLEVLWL
jgi:hypothetical protein